MLKRPNGEAENKRNWKQIIVRNSKINEGHQMFGETDRMREIGASLWCRTEAIPDFKPVLE